MAPQTLPTPKLIIGYTALIVYVSVSYLTSFHVFLQY